MLEHVQQYPTWAILNNNTFIIDDVGLTSVRLMDNLCRFCGPNDRLVILTVSRPGSTLNVTTNLNIWLKSHFSAPNTVGEEP